LRRQSRSRVMSLALAYVVPVQLEIQPDPDVGLVTMKIMEAGRPEVEVDLGPAAALGTAMKIVASIAQLREHWRNP
jgi:sugar/nucleoside kinase (ribokinase family)